MRNDNGFKLCLTCTVMKTSVWIQKEMVHSPHASDPVRQILELYAPKC